MEKTREMLINELKKFRDEKKIPQAKLAKRLGINEGALSSWLNDEYKGKNEEIDSKVEKFLSMEIQKNQNKIKEFGFVKTSIANQMFIAAQTCQMDSIMGICYGAPGLGKSTAIQKYAQNNNGVIIIDCEERMKVKLLIETLYRKLNLGNEKNWDLQDMKEKILKKLTESNWLLIVDEAEWLSEDSFTVLRKLHDRSGETFGILFTGTHKLYNNLIKLKGEYMYITSRIGFCSALKELEKEDVAMLIKQAISDPEEDLIDDIFTKTNRNTRVLANTLKRALKLSRINNIDINDTVITKSREMLIV